MAKLIVIFICMYAIAFSELDAATSDDKPNKQQRAELVLEEAVQDSTVIREIDTLKVFPSHYHGLVDPYMKFSKFEQITKHTANFDNYYTIKDIIENRSFSYSYDLGFPGKPAYISYYGGMPNSSEIMYNGRTLLSPETGLGNVDFISPEFFEKIEILHGSQATILSGKTSIINFSERRFNTAKPFTKMWYTQSGYGIIGVDGIFSQNFHPKWNIAVGFKNLAGDGRYTNSETNHWNFRSVLRYNPDDLSSISLSYNFNNLMDKQNGGVNLEASNSIGDIDAIVYFTSLRERIYRNDVTLSYSTSFDTLATKLFAANAYFSGIETQKSFKNIDHLILLDSSGKSLFASFLAGANARYEQEIAELFKIKSGADIMFLDLPETILNDAFSAVNYSVYSSLSFNFFDKLTLSGGIRYERYFDFNKTAFGADVVWNISDGKNLFFDVSRSEGTPSILQGLSKHKETHYLAIAGYRSEELESKLQIQLFARRISDFLMAEISMDRARVIYSDDCGCNERDIFGAQIKYSSKLLNIINYEIKADSYYSQSNGESDELYPTLILSGDAYYQYNIGASIFRGGISGLIGSPYKGFRFYPISKDFLLYDGKSKWMGDGLNAYVSLRLGNAFLRLGFDNILGQNYYWTKYYPMPSRMFHLSVSWAFDD